MSRIEFDGFSIELAAGWNDQLEDSTYSDPDEPAPITFQPKDLEGMLHVSRPLFEEEEQPGATVADVEALAHEWGERRGLSAPLASSSHAEPHASIATAVYRLGDEFVQVWFISNGEALIAASYACDWNERYEHQTDREAIVASLRFA